MFFVRLINTLAIVLLFASILGIVAALENENIGQMVISVAFFILSGFFLTGSTVKNQKR